MGFIKSILDTDLYEFSMSYMHFKLYPDAEGEWVFKDRNNTPRDEAFVSRLRQEIEDLSKLSLTKDEFAWCLRRVNYIPRPYWEWLSQFHYEPEKINIWLDEEKHLNITVCDKMYKAIMYEVPILAIVSELNSEVNGYTTTREEVLNKLAPKIALSNEKELRFAEFGARRRLSFQVHDWVVEELKRNARYCVGTSDVYLAYKYDMKPIGTLAHSTISFSGAMFGYRMANYMTMEAWAETYHGDLGTMLTDTFGSKIFFKNFSMKHAKLFDGVRQDSGDEKEFADMAIARYKELGINPMNKFIVFSNALDMPKFAEVAEYCKGKIGCSAGIGTNLTNDCGYPASNIVMKLMRCRMNDKQDWSKCIKISDDLGKHMGDSDEVELCKKTLGL